MFGFPIRVTPWFWAASLLLALGGGDDTPESVLIWVGVVFVSILVHELGHAFAIRYFGGESRITLYHFGGLAMDTSLQRSPGQQIAISFAGPAAGFLLAGIVTLALALSDNVYTYRWGLVPVIPQPFGRGEPALLDHLVWYLLFVNFAWGLINLLPIYPLDGGQISREIFVEIDPSRGIARSLWLSISAAVALALYALVAWHSLFIPIMFGALAYGSYQILQAYRGRGW